ncbi:MAG: DUF4405 domain-containing protein [Clostridiales bacterium]|nr:DUF4405 domain-containing protein [Clostridiales bacterium]
MKLKFKIKIAVDVGMTVLLLLLMAYELVGEAAHEWLGMGICVLFILHHVLNSNWSRNILKGRYSAFRIAQTILNICIALTMLGSMVSGMLMSEHTFSFLPIRSVYSYASRVHMLCAYWGFVLMSLHLGFHWNIMLGIAKKYLRPDKLRTLTIRVVALTIALFGVNAFWKRDIGNNMLLRYHFVYFDFEEPLIFFLLDYMTVMGLFVVVGYYGAKCLRRLRAKR